MMKCPQCGGKFEKKEEFCGRLVRMCDCGCHVITDGQRQTMTDEEIMRAAIDVFGPTAQRIKAIEEMSELAKELCKDALAPGRDEHIAEEIADVEIMIAQLKHIYKNHESVKSWKKEKILRLAQTVNKTMYERGEV